MEIIVSIVGLTFCQINLLQVLWIQAANRRVDFSENEAFKNRAILKYLQKPIRKVCYLLGEDSV